MAEQQLPEQLPPEAQQEASEEAALVQQAATKWTRTAFWAAQDSVHAAMLKHQAESLAGVSAAEEDVSNSALLHLELKVARKKLVRHPCSPFHADTLVGFCLDAQMSPSRLIMCD